MPIPAIVPALIAGGGAVAGGILQGRGAQKSADAQIEARNEAIRNSFDQFERRRDQAIRGNFAGQFGLEDVFGSRPRAEPFIPLDFEETQLDTIEGNIAAAPRALELKDILDTGAIDINLASAERLVPRFAENQAQLGNLAASFLRGEIPDDVAEEVARRRAQLSGATGTPGGAGPLVARDLGQTSIGLINQGGSLFQQMLNASEAISPVGQRFNPATQLLDPTNRIQLDILQRQLDQQSRQSAAFIEASPVPAAAQLFNAENQLGLVAAGLTSGAPSAGLGLQGFGQGISQGAGLLAALLQGRGGGGGGGAAGNNAAFNFSGSPFPTISVS